MVQAKVFNYSGIRVLLGDGASPEVFAAPCGFTERSLVLSKSLGEVNIPDCSNEDLASWVGRDVISKSASLTGSGVLDADALTKWQSAFTSSDESISARMELHRAGAKVGHFAGKFHVESFEIGGSQGQKATISVTLQSDGEVVWTAGT